MHIHTHMCMYVYIYICTYILYHIYYTIDNIVILLRALSIVVMRALRCMFHSSVWFSPCLSYHYLTICICISIT